MILKPEDIRKIRPVAENINDSARLVTYMRETETLRLVDAIGARLYRWLDEGDFWGDGPYLYEREDGIKISLTRDDYNTLMDGGYYETDYGTGRTEGLRSALAYMAYSKLVVNHPVNVTAFGIDYKTGQFSEKVDDSIVVRTSNEARKIGEAYLDGVVTYMRCLGLIKPCRTNTGSPSRNIVVKSRKL